MPRVGTITLYFDPQAYANEMDDGSRLTKAELENIGRLINEDAASYYGYEGWATKFVNVPDKKGRRR